MMRNFKRLFSRSGNRNHGFDNRGDSSSRNCNSKGTSGPSSNRNSKSVGFNHSFRSQNHGNGHKKSFSSGFSGRGRGGRNSFSRGRGGRSNAGWGRFNQATFDPTRLIVQAELQKTNAKVGENINYQIIHQFADFAICDQLKNNIAQRGYSTPTPIQDQIIPHILAGKDAVGIANTGTGKTAAFLIPLLDKVIRSDKERVLIITPTRELALQIRDELRAFSKNIRIFAALCIGGSSLGRQIDALRRHPHFVIGTPGRIKDLNQRGKIKFGEFTNIVLDEVDRMLDMGFVHEIRAIIERLPQNRQSLFFSATMTDRVKEIMKGFLSNPVFISVKTRDITANVNQKVIKIKGRSKINVLRDLLGDDSFSKVLVFGRTKRGAEKLSHNLQESGFRVNAIHGNKSQGQRQRALRQFKNNQLQALIATDVVARGLDIDNVTHVINYDLPESYENYIHRIGRTGRADKIGTALTFVE